MDLGSQGFAREAAPTFPNNLTNVGSDKRATARCCRFENSGPAPRKIAGTKLKEANFNPRGATNTSNFKLRTMSRYFFRISNGRPHEDDVGEELRDERQAWLSAKRLVRDIEDTLEPDGRWTVEVSDAIGPLYQISIAGRRLR
jgi:hypothetical protein